MRIGILTHYDVNNQGAQLQMYAMYKKLEELGHEAVILTYIKNYDFDKEKNLKYQVSIKSIPYIIKHYLLDNGVNAFIRNYKKYKLNVNFRKKNMKFENYDTANIDMAIVGSDEVFSIPMGINKMMYGHGVNTDKMISYAPSFGQTDISLIEERDCKEVIYSGLSKFVDISARDEHTFRLIEQLIEKTPTMVCDPAILYDFSELKIKCSKIPRQKYMVVYAYDHNLIDENEIKVIREYAKRNNLITVSPGTYHKWCDKNISCNILEWLEIFKNAECVVTDTFHGTITASITNKELAVFIRNKLNANKMKDLSEKLGITDRILNKFTDEEIDRIFSKKVDFNKVNSNINSLRKIGDNYLKTAIEKCQ